LDFGEVSNGFIFFGELLPKSDSSKNVVKWLLFIFTFIFKNSLRTPRLPHVVTVLNSCYLLSHVDGERLCVIVINTHKKTLFASIVIPPSLDEPIS
jgi:hypothetical protein